MRSTKGRLSGGYTGESWETPNGNKWKQDPNAFLFSCDLETVYPVVDTNKAIFCQAEFGPYFGNCDLGIHGQPFNGKENGYCRIGQSYDVPEDVYGASELTGELNKFTIAEIEVHAVHYL